VRAAKKLSTSGGRYQEHALLRLLSMYNRSCSGLDDEARILRSPVSSRSTIPVRVEY